MGSHVRARKNRHLCLVSKMIIVDNLLCGFLCAKQHHIFCFTVILAGFMEQVKSQWSQLAGRIHESFIDYPKHVRCVSVMHQFKHNERAKGIKQIGLWVGSTLLTQADCSYVCVWLCVCVVVHLLMCGSQILGYSSVLMPSFKDGRCNGRAGCRCVWRDWPESQENVWRSRRRIDSYLQMSSHHQSVIFLFATQGCMQPTP